MMAVSASTVSPFLSSSSSSSPSLPFLSKSSAFSFSLCSSSSSSSSHASSLHRIHGQIFAPHAKRKQTISSPSPDPTQTQYDEALDQAFRESINQLSTDAVKAMLSDDMKHMENVLDTVYELEVYFEREREEDALRFVLTIRDMLDHRISPEVKNLKGGYKKAFDKICCIIEDSGWILKGDKNELGVHMLDDELLPPTLVSQYK